MRVVSNARIIGKNFLNNGFIIYNTDIHFGEGYFTNDYAKFFVSGNSLYLQLYELPLVSTSFKKHQLCHKKLSISSCFLKDFENMIKYEIFDTKFDNTENRIFKMRLYSRVTNETEIRLIEKQIAFLRESYKN